MALYHSHLCSSFSVNQLVMFFPDSRLLMSSQSRIVCKLSNRVARDAQWLFSSIYLLTLDTGFELSLSNFAKDVLEMVRFQEVFMALRGSVVSNAALR